MRAAAAPANCSCVTCSDGSPSPREIASAAAIDNVSPTAAATGDSGGNDPMRTAAFASEAVDPVVTRTNSCGVRNPSR